MAFNPIGITTDAGWRLWARKAEPAPTLVDACCQSQLVLIGKNIEKFNKKPENEFFSSSDDVEEYNMWRTMFNTIQKAMIGNVTSKNDTLEIRKNITKDILEILSKHTVWMSIVNATEIDLIVYRGDSNPTTVKISIGKEVSIFDQMTSIFEFEKWGIVSWCGQGKCKKYKDDSPNVDSTREFTKTVIDGHVRYMISLYQKNGILSHLEIRESTHSTVKQYAKKIPAVVEEDDKIELRVFQARIPGFDDPHSWREQRKLTIQKSVNLNSMFRQIGMCVNYNDWGVVQLTNGTNRITLYDERSTAKLITMDPSTGERGIKFDEDFMAWMTACGVGRKVHLEITKRYILTAEDEDRKADAARAATLAARFQSITWV
jgi:hypothetical protein